MENEKFQGLVLEHLARITQEVTELKNGQQRLESRMDAVELRLDKIDSCLDKIDSRLDNVESRLDKIESRLDNVESRLNTAEQNLGLIKEQTAILLEFRTEINAKVDKLTEDVHFIKHKEHLNEEELFKLKAHLEIVK